MSLSTLPPEILREIVLELTEPHDIFPLLLVSHTFNSISKPLLYRTVCIKGKDQTREYDMERKGKGHDRPTWKLESGRELIREITFKGDADFQSFYQGIEKIWDHFDGRCDGGERPGTCLEEHTIEGLLCGKELDIEGKPSDSARRCSSFLLAEHENMQ